MELQQGFDMQLVSINPDKVKAIAKDQAYFLPMTIPKGTYGNAEDIPTAAIMNALVVRSDLSTDDVYKLTKTFFSSLDQLANSHQAAKEITLDGAQKVWLLLCILARKNSTMRIKRTDEMDTRCSICCTFGLAGFLASCLWMTFPYIIIEVKEQNFQCKITQKTFQLSWIHSVEKQRGKNAIFKIKTI